MKKNTDLYGGLFMIMISLLFLSKLDKLTEYSKIFPRAIILILITAGAGLLLKSRKSSSFSELFVLDDRKSALLVALITLAWVLLFKRIGFVITSVVSLTSLLCVLNDKKNVKEYFKSFVIAGCEIGLLYLIFSKILYVPFPKGLFF